MTIEILPRGTTAISMMSRAIQFGMCFLEGAPPNKRRCDSRLATRSRKATNNFAKARFRYRRLLYATILQSVSYLIDRQTVTLSNSHSFTRKSQVAQRPHTL